MVRLVLHHTEELSGLDGPGGTTTACYRAFNVEPWSLRYREASDPEHTITQEQTKVATS
jgi:hypothetical protein